MLFRRTSTIVELKWYVLIGELSYGDSIVSALSYKYLLVWVNLDVPILVKMRSLQHLTKLEMILATHHKLMRSLGLFGITSIIKNYKTIAGDPFASGDSMFVVTPILPMPFLI